MTDQVRNGASAEDQVIAAALALVKRRAASPNCQTTVRIRIDADTVPPFTWLIRAPLGPRPEPPPDPPAPRESDCPADILATLQAVGHRLTQSELISEMDERGYPWSDRSIQRYLSRLTRDGEINNRQDATPSGYGLSDWEDE